jgi:hypothetical protein
VTGTGAKSLTLEGARIAAGCWRAELVAPDRDEAPAIEVWHQEARLDGVSLAAPSAPGRWPVAVPIPASLLSDGVQTFVVREVTIVTGVPLEDDIRAEIDLLRAELDMLKKAFRRHCAETDGT